MSELTRIPVALAAPDQYEIVVGYNCLDKLPEELTHLIDAKTLVIITHPIIKELFGDTLKCELDKHYTCHILTVPEGESSKSLDTVSDLLDQLLELKLERKDAILALGGGVIGDLSGFVASIYLRGLPVIQIPTTLLAQVDAAIGGKTGVNHAKGKNLIGAFHQPKMTFIDIQLLESLPKNELRSGLAEIIKYGMICNPDLYRTIESNKASIQSLSIQKDTNLWKHMIIESCKNKAEVVAKDEKESGLRAILNFGHTLAHALESGLDYSTITHGEAVATGMIAASKLALKVGLFDASSVEKFTQLLLSLGYSDSLHNLSNETIIEIMSHDKKVIHGKLRFVLPTEVGKVTIKDDIDQSTIESVLNEMKRS